MLTQSTHSFTNKDEMVSILVNEEVRKKQPYIKVESFNCWRTKKEAIKYYQFILRCIEEIK